MILDRLVETPMSECADDPLLAGLIAEAVLLSADIESWRLRMPMGPRSRANQRWLAEGHELLRRRARLDVLARRYGLIDIGS